MPPKKRAHTLNDLNLLEGNYSTTKSETAWGNLKVDVAHIPDLPNSDATQNLLQRIHSEFFPIVKRRGFRISSISEMCCCGDGLDFVGSESRRAKRPKRRRRRVMASNVLGYNQTVSGRWGKIHTIHLRLRNAKNHQQLLSYEEVAGTMAHELAHCVHGAHSAAFYKLMDEIQEEHAVLLARGVTTESFLVGKGYVLGSSGKNGKSAASVAEARRQKLRWMPKGPQKLGGDASFQKMLTAGEAAATAAETRRLEDEKWCLPCADPDVIDLLESDNEEDVAKANTIELLDQSSKDTQEIQANEIMVLSSTVARPPLTDKVTCKRSRYTTEKNSQDLADGQWVCHACTFRNSSEQVLICEICRTERSTASETLIAKIIRDDEIQRIKEKEVEESNKDFGFNIYGNGQKKSSTMSHIT
mmetsp:Transcript_31204/g.47202  ORF Transcript_31204/g.47202 Transcript_31204/m.47202 type:complete len:415 (+) Transcript_31204:255-1499(+)